MKKPRAGSVPVVRSSWNNNNTRIVYCYFYTGVQYMHTVSNSLIILYICIQFFSLFFLLYFVLVNERGGPAAAAAAATPRAAVGGASYFRRLYCQTWQWNSSCTSASFVRACVRASVRVVWGLRDRRVRGMNRVRGFGSRRGLGGGTTLRRRRRRRARV